MADEKITPKQEAFALAYFETGNAAEAYRRAYDVSENTKDQWLYVEASQLLDNPKVALRLSDLQEQAEKLSMFTRIRALEEYEQARLLALSEKNASAAVGATAGKVKLFGLDAPAKVKAEHTGKDGGPIKAEVTGSEKLSRFLDQIAERSGTAGESDA